MKILNTNTTPLFKVEDLVTVVESEPVWYTYLDDIRKEHVGKTGRVMSVEKQVFTKEDIEWYQVDMHHGYNKDHPIPNDFTYTIFNYVVRFPVDPEREINFSEVHLKAFEMPERKREFSKKVDDSEVFSKCFSFNDEIKNEPCGDLYEEFAQKMSEDLFDVFFGENENIDYTEETNSLIKKLHEKCAVLEGEKTELIRRIDGWIEKSKIFKNGYPNTDVYNGLRRERQIEIDVLYKIKLVLLNQEWQNA